MQPQVSSENAQWNALGEVFSEWDIYTSSYVDPPSFSVQLTPGTHHPESVPRSVPETVSAVGRPVGLLYTELKLS